MAIGGGVLLDTTDVDIHLAVWLVMRIADHEVGDHAHIIIGGEPVIGGESVSGIAHDLVEAVAELGALAGEDIHPIDAIHEHRTAIDAIAREDALSGSDGVGRGIHLVSTDVDIDLSRLAGGGLPMTR